MAQTVNTYDSYDSNRNRETFSDAITMITPEETPFFSLIGKQSVEGTHPEWSTDTLATPTLDNAAVEGDQYSYSAITPTVRVGNYCQISKKEFIVSRTQELVSKAGPKSDLGRERAKKGLELKIDMEVSMLSNNASVAGAAATARKSAGFRAWLSTNDSLGAGAGASGGYNTATGVVDAATNGTQRTFTKALLDDTIQNTYNAGGSPTVLMVSPYVKRVFSTFMSDANVAAFRAAQSGTKQGTIYGAADAYVSDFGVIDVVPNRQMSRLSTGARNAFLIDVDKVAKGFLDPIHEDKEVAKLGDAEPRVIICEWTLVVKNEAAHGVVADLFGLTSAT
jgi:hypothetical protein